MEEEGAHLIEGVADLKVHSKLCLISREENNELVNYAIISTGNFNEMTAKIYSDHALFTLNKDIVNDVKKIFAFLHENYKTYRYKSLLVSPFFMRKRFEKLIKNETKNAIYRWQRCLHLC